MHFKLERGSRQRKENQLDNFTGQMDAKWMTPGGAKVSPKVTTNVSQLIKGKCAPARAIATQPLSFAKFQLLMLAVSNFIYKSG
jgi:hypothetical protein